MKIDFVMGFPKRATTRDCPYGNDEKRLQKNGDHASGKTLMGHDGNDNNNGNIDIVGVPLVGTQ